VTSGLSWSARVGEVGGEKQGILRKRGKSKVVGFRGCYVGMSGTNFIMGGFQLPFIR